MRRLGLAVLALLLAASCAKPASAPETTRLADVADVERGRLLYENVCGACHTTQPHWREKHIVHSWDDLVYQVGRWQNVAGQTWTPSDIRDVAAFLNWRFYHLPCREKGCAGHEA